MNLLDINGDSRVDVELRSDRKNYTLGEIPKIETIITNKTDTIILLLPSLDGSNDSLRYPITKYNIYRNDRLLTNSRLRCGNLDGLSFDRFSRLNPGEYFDPTLSTSWVYREHLLDSGSFQQRGRYRINFYYSTDQDTLQRWLGWNSSMELDASDKEIYKKKIEEYKKAFAMVPKISVLSNTLEFEIR